MANINAEEEEEEDARALRVFPIRLLIIIPCFDVIKDESGATLLQTIFERETNLEE